ncbi:uroporphyrinogen-III C-methyltransferase [Leptospira sp. 2 VSF19]|uniref:uroporphyrinogen-III C-methyltransferase n=1 Tax=Leptospira soteropolitanensis TaxID=2950025 RepID=A0AAW5VH78_9LEPT|nr:uroporphyrinogen-III C-methyltransferase [Leptospira soteropolitanensis]MCW7494504.1 uroporphyrinogen-III C-methyltransferase [Leptospira soteropolitanensis]MCW7502098.1 uroporphyrinogen-III C-methyltransferase [Leptospira soteropolitanensis]MCW7524350.1 uroporphyrinogen-III C-methyltransferase [Leptospira soteropolitanensis]MCW7528216.1 uroporphyrinogen-III C-methyltransferase [Leptospira soteropolitanensis]MCW7532068.1 uroporphyrinogen-III C-methyltransferase [Leptospira soteropolitanensi
MSSNKTEQGFVSFVSGGPGPIDLLTLRGRNRIESAEVILYDALLDPGYLELFPENAQILYVGKRAGEHARTQEEINHLLVEFAKEGKRVVRLKGGDAAVFGRLAEEIQSLEVLGIPFEVVPGVSSVTAGTADLGISLTVRGISRQIIILDGHTILEDERSWMGMENFLGTIVILMGSKKTKELAERLIQKGIKDTTPIVLAENVGRGNPTYTSSTLAEISLDGITKQTSGPGILYVGEALRPLLNREEKMEKKTLISLLENEL